MAEPKKIHQFDQDEQSFEDDKPIDIERLANKIQNMLQSEVQEELETLESTSEESQPEAQIIPLTDIDNVVNEIANKTNESKIQVLRKAISLMKIVIQAKEQGYKFGLTKDSNKLDSEISL